MFEKARGKSCCLDAGDLDNSRLPGLNANINLAKPPKSMAIKITVTIQIISFTQAWVLRDRLNIRAR